MRKTIVVADRDERLQQAFMTVFAKEQYEVVYAPNGKEVERIAGRAHADFYIVNVNLPKVDGVEVYKKLRQGGYLDTASFFFLKDEGDETQLEEYPAEGVIEKPINFFRLYEAVIGDDDVIELTDLIDEKAAEELPRAKERPREEVEREFPSAFVRALETQAAPKERGEADAGEGEGATLRDAIGIQLRDAIDNVDKSVRAAEVAKVPAETAPPSMPELEQQFKTVLGQAMEEAANKLSARLAPVLTQYVEDYVKQMLLQVTERVVREEIDKLLKEPRE
jgi:CheY-like chemotaxis protein